MLVVLFECHLELAIEFCVEFIFHPLPSVSAPFSNFQCARPTVGMYRFSCSGQCLQRQVFFHFSPGLHLIVGCGASFSYTPWAELWILTTGIFWQTAASTGSIFSSCTTDLRMFVREKRPRTSKSTTAAQQLFLLFLSPCRCEGVRSIEITLFRTLKYLP